MQIAQRKSSGVQSVSRISTQNSRSNWGGSKCVSVSSNWSPNPRNKRWRAPTKATTKATKAPRRGPQSTCMYIYIMNMFNIYIYISYKYYIYMLKIMKIANIYSNNYFWAKIRNFLDSAYSWFFAFYVGKLEGHERAFPPSISNWIGTSRIPVKKNIVLKGQNDVLTYTGVRIRGKYWNFGKKISFFFLVIK